MAQRCRLTTRAQVDGAVREPGYEFLLADGERGPHRTRLPVHPSINASHVAGHDHGPSEGADEPLYEVIEEEAPVAETERSLIAQADAGAAPDHLASVADEAVEGEADPT